MKSKKINQDLQLPAGNSGFSLIEITVALGILGVLVLVVANFSTTAMGFFSNINKTASIADLMEEMRFTMAAPNACTKNFGGRPLSMAVPLTLNSVSNYSSKLDALTGDFITSGKETNGLKVESIRLIPQLQLTDTVIVSNLQVEFSKTGEGAGSKTATRKIPIFAKTRAGVIDKCWIKQEYASLEYNQMCTAATGGALNAYDPATGACTLASGQWFEGTSTSASCPPGASLPKGVLLRDLTIYNCKIVEPSGGIFDPLQGISTIYQDGVDRPMRRSSTMISVDPATQTCNCAYGVEISGADVGGSKCAILCYIP